MPPGFWRDDSKRRMWFAFHATLGLLFASMMMPAFAAESRPPNIVLIVADDLGWAAAGYQAPEPRYPTPHIDRLARDPSEKENLTNRYPGVVRDLRDRLMDWIQNTGAPLPSVPNH